MRRGIVGLLFACAMLAQNTPKYPAALPTYSDLLIASNVPAPYPTLTAGINSSVTVIPVTSTAGFAVPTAILIDSEFIRVCTKDSTNFNVCGIAGSRGFDNTTAVSHLTGATVRTPMIDWFHNQTAAELLALMTAAGTNLTWHGNTSVGQRFGGGSLTANDCAKFDTNGNVVSAGGPCGTLTSAPVTSVNGLTGAVSLAELISLTQLSDVSGKKGNGNIVQMFGGGTPATGELAQYNSSGNLIGSGVSVASLSTGTSLPSMTDNEDRVLSTDGTIALWTALGGDLTGAPGSVTVTAVMGTPWYSTAPTNLQFPQYIAENGRIEWRTLPASASNATAIQGIPVSVATPAPGQALIYNALTASYLPTSLPAGGGSGGYTTIQANGTPLTARAILNFIGSAVTSIVDNAGALRTDVTLTAGTGGGGGSASFVNGPGIEFADAGAGVVRISASPSVLQWVDPPATTGLACNLGEIAINASHRLLVCQAGAWYIGAVMTVN